MTPGCLINTPVPTLPFKCGTRINTRIGAERRNNRTVSLALHLILFVVKKKALNLETLELIILESVEQNVDFTGLKTFKH